LNNFDLSKYREFLFTKYARQYARLQIGYVKRFNGILENPNLLNEVPRSIRSNVLKSITNLSKYLGRYDSFKKSLKQYGITWESGDTSFNAFLNIVNNEHSSLGEWYLKAEEVLPENYQLLLKFTLVTGARKWEAITGFNLIIKLARENKLDTFYNEELKLLEWFKVKDENDNFVYLRDTKNIFISAVSKTLINEIAESDKVYYTTLRKKLNKCKLTIRVKELRSYYATYLRQHGILAEYIDLLQGRIPKSVFARHYLKVEDVKVLVVQVVTVTDNLERSLLS
jgi:hypothetical protein